MPEDHGPVLNPELVRVLGRFGQVLVGNQGQAADISTVYKAINGQVRKVADVRTWGEYYRVDCPLCSDTRKRLNFSHLWGTADPVTGRPMLHLVRCHNENCIDDRDGRKNLQTMLFGPRTPPQVALPGQMPDLGVVSQGTLSPTRKISLPEGVVATSDPSCPRQAIRYLDSRGFDPAELATQWDVGYTPSSNAPRPRFADRIVIPVYDVVRPIPINRPPETVLVGWQARRLDDGTEKYLFARGMQKSQILYGLPQALGTLGPIVVVEGVTDVWRLGSHAVATFGKKPSPIQLKLLAQFDGRPLVVFRDSEAEAEAEAASTRQQILDGRAARDDESDVVIAVPPSGRKDPGECSREEAWEAVAQALHWTEKKLSRERKHRTWS